MNQDFWTEFSRSLNEYQSAWVATGAIAAGVAGVAAVLWLAWPTMRRAQQQQALFRRFCDASGLTGPERRLALRLARARFPHRPLLIFVSPSTFEKAAAEGPALSPAEGLNLTAVREKLFGPNP